MSLATRVLILRLFTGLWTASFLFLAARESVPAQPGTTSLGPAERQHVLNTVVDNLQKYYFDPTVARKTAAALRAGADEFLIKPLQPSVVRTRIRAMLRNKALIDSLEEAEAILFALAQAVEQRDSYTGMHCERLASHSVTLGQALGLSRQEQIALFRGGYLHDIGKISIPDAILFKRGLLTDEEWKTMRLHTVRGEEICRPMKTLAPVLPIIRSHHERWDGSGYPDGLRGEDIPLLGRILQVADIYDALTSARPYKPAFSHQHAIEIMFEETNRGWRDPELVPLFAEITQRELDGGRTADLPIRQSLENMRRELAK